MKKISPRRTRAYAATTLAIVLVAAACGGENNADPPATSAVVPNTTPATVLPPATDPAQTTTTTPTPMPTTTAPTPSTTTGLNEEEQAKQAVIEAAENAWHLFNEAKLDPTNDQKLTAALAVHSGDARARVDEIIRNYRESNRKSVTSDVAPAIGQLDLNSVQVDLVSGTATIELCNVSSNVMVEVGAEPDGSDRVLDDSITAYDTLETYVLEDGAWLNYAGEILEVHEGALTCDSHD